MADLHFTEAFNLSESSDAICTALHQLQDRYAAAKSRVEQLQEEKAVLKADARHMAENLFSELSYSQEQSALLTAEVEQLRTLQAELAEAAAAEAERCRRSVETAESERDEALQQLNAAKLELRDAQHTMHQLELKEQESKARHLVEKESLTAEIEKLEHRLMAAEAGAAAQQSTGKLWQQKLGSIEEQMASAQEQLKVECLEKEDLQKALEEIKQEASRAKQEAHAFKKVVASNLLDLSELCSALKTAQCAMAVDGSSKPAYLRALSHIESSLQRVAAVSESALEATQPPQRPRANKPAALTSKDIGSGNAPRNAGSPAAGLLGSQLQQQLHDLLQSSLYVQLPADACDKKGALLRDSLSTSRCVSTPCCADEGSCCCTEHCHTEGASPSHSQADAQPAHEAQSCTALIQAVKPDGAGLWHPQNTVDMQTASMCVCSGTPAKQSMVAASALHPCEQPLAKTVKHHKAVAATSAQSPCQSLDCGGADGQEGGTKSSTFIEAFRAKHGRGNPPLRASQTPDLNPNAPAHRKPNPLAAASPRGEANAPLSSQAVQHTAGAPAAIAVAAKGPARSSAPVHGSRKGQRSQAPPNSRLSAPHHPSLPIGAVTSAGAGKKPAVQLWEAVGRQAPSKGHGAALAAAASAAESVVSTMDNLSTVVMAVEDELATLDLRHATLLKQSARLRGAESVAGDITAELEGEKVARVIHSVREAMQQKGKQLAQLMQYRNMLAAQ